MSQRISILFVVFSVLFASLVFKAARLQVFPDARLEERYARQLNKLMQVEGRRGYIYDRNGQELAASVVAYSIYADPKLVRGARRLARRLAPILGEKSDVLYQKLKNRKRRFVWLARRQEERQRKQIEALQEPGLGVIEEPKRVYPNESLLANVLGFVGSSSQGLGGVEVHFESLLNGSEKSLSVQRDARGRPLFINGVLFQESPDGYNLHLSIEQALQHQLEVELKRVVELQRAKGAVGVILDAENAEVLAMANYPSFNPNEALRAPQEYRRNAAVTDPFEPGSTLKTFTIAAALREKIAKAESKYFCENGSFQVGRRKIREADTKHSFAWLSVEDILKKSSNIGTSKIAIELGDEALRRSLLDFGFGAKSSQDFPGESRGILPSLPWNRHLLSNISFGHGVAASPLQIANAYVAIANGGQLYRPSLLRKITDSEGRNIELRNPQILRRVLSPELSREMRRMLGRVTESGGTAEKARVEGFLVGGKTGTAQKVDLQTGQYQAGAYVANFAGIIPLDRPRLVIYLAVDEPQKDYYASEVVAPSFAKIASFAARHYGWKPSVSSSIRNAVTQRPTTQQWRKKKTIQSAVARVSEDLRRQSWQTMPDLRGMSLREAMRELRAQGLDIEIYGQGRLSESLPRRGERLVADEKVKLYFR